MAEFHPEHNNRSHRQLDGAAGSHLHLCQRQQAHRCLLGHALQHIAPIRRSLHASDEPIIAPSSFAATAPFLVLQGCQPESSAVRSDVLQNISGLPAAGQVREMRHCSQQTGVERSQREVARLLAQPHGSVVVPSMCDVTDSLSQ